MASCSLLRQFWDRPCMLIALETRACGSQGCDGHLMWPLLDLGMSKGEFLNFTRQAEHRAHSPVIESWNTLGWKRASAMSMDLFHKVRLLKDPAFNLPLCPVVSKVTVWRNQHYQPWNRKAPAGILVTTLTFDVES